jgi:NAD(P)-dependent dehydrogenase (short-subunit alcohol dehydrogenase family)
MKAEAKVAIVTGGGRGIGRAIAFRLAKEGANVAVAQRNLEEAKKVADEIRALGSRAIAVKVDVTKSAETNQMAKATLDEFGQIDILVNNAGGSAEAWSSFHESKEEVWDQVFALNLKGVFNCSWAVIRHMMDRRSGKIINIASIAGVTGLAKLVDYSAAKAGVIGFTKALAKEVGEYGINVNCVSPSATESERIALRLSEEDKEQQRKMTLVGRLGKPEDVANMVAFLVSDEASFITGQNYLVCGGRSLGYK